MSLQNIQSEFLELLFSDADNTDFFTPASHIAIYRRNITTRLTQTLAHIYPLIAKLTGMDFFKQMAKDYLLCYPSRSGNLNDYGEYFPDFVTEYPGLENYYYLSDVARFEWHCHVLQFASDHTALDLAKLEAVAPHEFDNLHFILHPASCLMTFSFPLLRIIDLCQTESKENLHLDEGEEYLLIMRRETVLPFAASPSAQASFETHTVHPFDKLRAGSEERTPCASQRTHAPQDERIFAAETSQHRRYGDIAVLPLSLPEYHFLSSLQAGNTLGHALETTLRLCPDFKLEEQLPQWIQQKILVAFYPGEISVQIVDKA